MAAGLELKPPAPNPYVGPRPFTREESTRFFGRESEGRDLLSLAVSEQLVLFYAQSGAGKSSLVNTRLVPGLEERGFEVLPIGRVSGEALKSDQCDNIFIFNLLTNIDQSKTAPERFARMRLGDFLANLSFNGQIFLYADPTTPAEAAADPGGAPQQVMPRALIIDQFEELITGHPEAWEKRGDFFEQLAEAMAQDPYLWIVLVMREDYVASLDPFAHLLPNQLRARFYMRRMGSAAALEAVRKPVEAIRPFDAGIAETLVDNLRLVGGVPGQDAQSGPLYGEFIEPVQLQVVCFQLWSNLMNEAEKSGARKTITQADIDSLAKGESLAQFINKALGDFYEQAVARVLEKLPGQVSEQELRNWFSTQLITEAETRGFVYQGKSHTAGLPNEAVSVLAAQYIIRPETRPGGTWYELVHDRFISPILQANRKWMAANQSRLLTDARAWEAAGRPASRLYEGRQLEAAQSDMDSGRQEVSPLEKEFINLAAKEAKRRRDARTRLAFVLGTLLVLILAGLTGWALSQLNVATKNYRIAQANLDQASAAQATISGQNATAQVILTELARKDLVQQTSINRLNGQINALVATVVGRTEGGGSSSLNLTDTPAAPETPLPPPIPGSSSPPPTGSGRPTSTAAALVIPSPTAVGKVLPDTGGGPADTVVIGKSAGGKDILVTQFGNGPRHLVLVGGLHAGYSPSTVLITQRLAEYFYNNPADVPDSFTIDIVMNANPDSLTAVDLSSQVIGRLNANKVDLNRNWDCFWRPDATWTSLKVPVSGGSAAFSEPETRALKDFILGNLSVAVVVWEAREVAGEVADPGGCGEKSLFSQPLTDLYGKAAGYGALTYIPYTVTGAMTDYLDSQGIPSISVYLPDFLKVSSDDFLSQILAIRKILSK